MNRTISWEHWTHPLGGGEEYEEGETKTEEEDEEDDVLPPIRPVIFTSAGLMPLKVYSNFSENFNFWMMHTNFSISKRVMKIIKSTPGVEVLDVTTRYRTRVGFAKMFGSEQVKAAIQKALNARPPLYNEENPGNYPLPQEIRDKVLELEGDAKAKGGYWTLLVLPNGQIHLTQSDDHKGYREALELYRETQDIAGGIIAKSVKD